MLSTIKHTDDTGLIRESPTLGNSEDHDVAVLQNGGAALSDFETINVRLKIDRRGNCLKFKPSDLNPAIEHCTHDCNEVEPTRQKGLTPTEDVSISFKVVDAADVPSSIIKVACCLDTVGWLREISGPPA